MLGDRRQNCLDGLQAKLAGVNEKRLVFTAFLAFYSQRLTNVWTKMGFTDLHNLPRSLDGTSRIDMALNLRRRRHNFYNKVTRSSSRRKGEWTSFTK